jgi:hypothetical protein
MQSHHHPFARVARACFIAALSASALIVRGAPLDTAKIEQITGMKGTLNKQEGVFKVSAPRKDVPVTVEGWKMPPFMGLTSWAAFESGGKSETMVMGDIVLFEDEVNTALSAALDHGLEVTALHNHFLFDQPKVYFMHIGGDGPTAQLATGVKAVFDAIAQYRASHKEFAQRFVTQGLPAESTITPAPLESVFGAKALAQGGMAKFVFGREVTMECGCTAGKEMGVNTWAAFAGSDDNAIIDGDFVVTAAELQPALKSLRADGVNIVAIHSHMTEDTPHMLFFHYWGRGKAADLAASVKKALPKDGK